MESLFAVQYSWLIPLLPLMGAMVAGFFGARWLRGQSHWPIWIGVGASALLSISLLVGMAGRLPHPEAPPTDESAGPPSSSATYMAASAARHLFTWIGAGNFRADAAFFIDPLTAVMLCVVTGIGFLITVFAAGYMAGESGYFRFFAYLGLFIFAMTCLVLGENFVMLYLGWEGVGLCSYLLIGYHYDKPAAREAAKKAFLVNRVGDFGFGLGIMLIYVTFGTVSFFGTVKAPGVLVLASTMNWSDPAQPHFWIPFLLMLGAFGKSAQFPLHVWLPDAMEGPTPVSALIHAATMVTAGVYMIVRCSTLFYGNLAAMATIAVVGAFTALFAASIALRQFDLKKVFAYSTVSQLGFMFVAAGVFAPVAGIFHLMTHAFFKALLFLSSGVVMHAMAGELDLRKMSGLKRVLPKTRWVMLLGCCALAGIIPFSGFWSKDEILIAAFDAADHRNLGRVLGLVMTATAFLTAYYTFRLYFRVFEGPEVIPAGPAGHGYGHADDHAHASESAVRTGTAHESGVDEHLTHAAPAHDSHKHGHGHGDHGHHNPEPLVMMLPLFLLAIGAVFAGFVNAPNHHAFGDFLGHSPSFKLAFAQADTRLTIGPVMTREGPKELKGRDRVDPAMFGAHPPKTDTPPPHRSHGAIMILSILVALLGVLVAYVMHLQDRPRAEQLAARHPFVTRLLEAKYWVDEAYQAGIVEPLRRFGRVLFAIDQYVVDGVVWIVSFVPQIFGFSLRLTTQRGHLQGYAVMMLLGVAVILLLMFMR